MGTSHVSGTADRLTCCQLSLPVCVVLMALPLEQLLITPTIEICIQQLEKWFDYHNMSLCVMRVCHWQRRLLYFIHSG